MYHALNTNVKVLRLSRKKVADCLGNLFWTSKPADFRLMHWLNAQEDNYQLVIYECDYTSTNWTRRCLRQADAIFVVANGEAKPPNQQFFDEHLKMNQDGIRTRKELVLLWKEDVKSPTGTTEWLNESWFSGHYHIRAPNRMFSEQFRLLGLEDESEVIDYYESNIFPGKADFYMLGGGGARGAAHVGIIKALREHGIPVDIVGGTSIGSMIGGIFAGDPHQDRDFESTAKSWFMVMSSLWRKIWI
uniref:PNPLA domain-containing protein n=1 Tax=Ditylenchus dipsaci TaxID=166011 RepID=A0A915CNT3_9BILA